ncbi:TonB-dependent receptor domain-containing protein [Parasediminibacterium sp. JCM 36343]|uniref:TonB-dependent receptor n=1 Tax=Parasediminibacterium sp. JCM 36343 TaxID=3374279 RepID=UPI00397A59FB
MKRKFTQLLATFLLLGCCFVVSAQETTSDIVGTVTDKGKGVPGASVTAIHLPTGTKYVTSTRKDGRYNIPNAKIGGPYSVTIGYVGYKTEKQDGIYLSLGQEFKVDFGLTPESAMLTEVVVKGGKQDKVFNNSRTGSQEVITRNQLERLPTINRSFQDFTKLTPSSNGLNFGGVNASYNNLTVDGANFNNVFGLSSTLGGQTGSQPISIDAIEQIQVNLSPYDVRQGNFTGAGVNSVTRSGTNQFKGSVYNYIRNNNLQGYKVKSVDLLANGATKPQFDYTQIGATLGGPIIKNKVFFFASYEQEKISTPATSLVALQPGQTAGGNISQAKATDLDSLRNFLISRYGYNPGEYQNYNYRTESKKATVKIDWNINDKNTFTIKYNYLHSLKDIAASNSGAQGTRQPSTTGLPFSGNGYTINNNFDIFIAELNTRLTNKISNKLQIGYSALRDFRAPLANGNFPLVDILNGQGQTYTSFGYEPFTYNNKLNSDIFQYSDIATYYYKSHEITAGAQYYYKKFLNGFAPNYQGLYRFNTLQDFYDGATNPALNKTSLFNLQYATTPDGSFPFGKTEVHELGFFAQDKWRVNSQLTVTYGIRGDVPIFVNKFDKNDALSALPFRDGIRVDVGQKPKTQMLFSPRVGFNWDVNGDKVTQIRGGIGLFAGPPPFVWISNQASNNGVQFGSFSRTAPQPFLTNIDSIRKTFAGKLSPNYNIAVTDPKFKYPQNLKASLAIDRKLPDNWTVTVEANYAHDINAVYFQNIGLPTTGSPLVGPDNRIRYSSSQIYAGSTLDNPNISSAILMKNSSKGYSYYLTFQAVKTLKNFTGSVAYTYNQSKTINDGGSIAQSNWRDRPVSGDPNANDLSYSNFYQPHRVIAYGTYRAEYAKYFATSIGLTFEAATNGTASYTYNGDVNNDGSGGNNDLIYIPRNQSEIVLVKSSATDPRTPGQIWSQLDNYINQDAYLSQRRGQYAERNGALAPYFKKLNMNITQDFYYKTKDNVKHTLRVTFDIFNVGNLINRQWGVVRTFNNSSPIRYVGLGSDGKPMFTVPFLDNANQIPLVNSYRDDTGIGSRWQAQIGVRYLFN